MCHPSPCHTDSNTYGRVEKEGPPPERTRGRNPEQGPYPGEILTGGLVLEGPCLGNRSVGRGGPPTERVLHTISRQLSRCRPAQVEPLGSLTFAPSHLQEKSQKESMIRPGRTTLSPPPSFGRMWCGTVHTLTLCLQWQGATCGPRVLGSLARCCT